MRPLTPILHTATVAERPLRFVAPPLTGPDFPWHVAEDLFMALRFPRAVRREFQQRLQGKFSGEVRTVATSSGIVMICPHYMAQGSIGAAEEIGCAPYEAAGDYARAGAAALTALTNALGLSGHESVAYACDAFKRGQR